MYVCVSFCVCVCLSVCALFIYVNSIIILCVSREERSLTESNQQIYDFYKSVIFENQIHGAISASYLFSVIQTAAVSM